jgi:hypothetical protein
MRAVNLWLTDIRGVLFRRTPARPWDAALCEGGLHVRAAVTWHCLGDRHWSILFYMERYTVAEEEY